jgi:cellulose synthase/poly-beta-1,6-N-acetylglucosamine synthase-like glycosyltransferase
MGGFGGRNLNASIKPFMCNGANLCYLKTEFIQLNGYSGSKHIASGDDVFLLEKMIVRDSKKVHFIKSRAAVVSTLPKYSWKELVEQRKRWAAKTSSIGNGFGKAVGALVLLANLALIIGLGSAIGGLIHWKSLGILFLVKINVDFILIYKTALFFDKKEALRSFIASSLLYPFFVVLVSVLALNGSYHWKGRSFRK